MGIVRARDDSCNNAVLERLDCPDLRRGLVRAVAHLDRQTLYRSIPARARETRGLHAPAPRREVHPRACGTRRCCMNTLWGWGRASWAGCGPDVRRGGHPEIDADHGIFGR